MSLIIPFSIIIILILLNGMFVAAEFAIIGVRQTRIKQLADDGDPLAKRLYVTLKDPAKVDRYIASAQLGITLASLGLGMYGEPHIAHLIEAPLHDIFHLEGEIVHTIGFLTALGIITYLHVVVGEMVPKSLSLQNAERTVFVLARPMLLMQTIFSYPITALNWIGLQVLRLLRISPPESGSRLTTPDELELIVSESVVGGLLDPEEHELISSIFEFGDLDVAQMMTPRPKIRAVSVDVSERELLEMMTSAPHTRFPIYDGTLDSIVGIVHLRDVVEQQLDKQTFDIRSMMHEVPFIPETASAEKLLAIFKEQHIHMAVVIDEFGGTAGIVTLEDLIEEIVGEVRDEFDVHETEPITVVEPGHLMVQGTVRLGEIADYVDLGEEHDEIDTIGGLMMSQLNLPPSVGEEVVMNDVTLRIEAVDGLATEQVSVHFTPEEPDEADEPDADHDADEH